MIVQSNRRWRAAMAWKAYCIPIAMAMLAMLALCTISSFYHGAGPAPAPPHGMAWVEGRLLLDINAADMEMMEELPGIGETLARAIVEYREANGGFQNIGQLDEVEGIGNGRLAGISDRICAMPYGG